MSDIFISYARKDRPRAKVLASALEAKGWSVWWDRDIRSGKPFDRVIEEALAKAKCVIVVWSPDSVNSDWVRVEASEGLKREILIPVLIEKGVEPPLRFRQIQSVDLFDWDGTKSSPEFDKLVADIADILGPPAKAEMEQVAVGETEEVATTVLEREEEPVLAHEPVPPEVEVPALDPPRPEQMALTETEKGGPHVVEQEREPTLAPEPPPPEPSAEAPRPPPPPPWPKLLPWFIGIALLASVFVAFWVFQKPEPIPRVEPPVTPPTAPITAPTPPKITPGRPTKATPPKGMVLVPAGEFWMGCNEKVDRKCRKYEKPGRKIYLDAFSIDKHEVTVAHYRKCVEAGKCSNDGLTSREKCNWDKPGREDHPVNCVDWNQAKTYCAWAGKRLLTEAEWEKAARGTKGRIYPWGNQWDSSRANVGTGGTVSVGSNASGVSPYGVYDMAGNVWEWTSSLDKSYPYLAEEGREGPKNKGYRVFRGGSWWRSSAEYARTSTRNWNVPAYRYFSIGFRCAKTP